MSHPDAQRWNLRYRDDGDKWLSREPNGMLVEFAHLLPPGGLALDLAAGVGTNSLFLAQRGLRVIALDISEVGLRLAQENFEAHDLRLDAAICDLSKIWLPPNHFDVIVNFHFLDRATYAPCRGALKPGGILLFETLLRGELRPDPSDYYLEPGELLNAFGDFEVLHSAIRKHKNDRVTEQIVVRKPRMH